MSDAQQRWVWIGRLTGIALAHVTGACWVEITDVINKLKVATVDGNAFLIDEDEGRLFMDMWAEWSGLAKPPEPAPELAAPSPELEDPYAIQPRQFQRHPDRNSESPGWEACFLCGKNIRFHFGGTEYRCDAEVESRVAHQCDHFDENDKCIVCGLRAPQF